MPVGSPVWALTALDRKQAGLSPENRKRRICHGRDHGREKGADPGGDSRSGVTGDPGEKAGKKYGRQEKAAAYDPADRCAGGRGRPDRRRREILQKEGRQQRGRHGDGVLRRYQLRGGRQRSGKGQDQRNYQPDHCGHGDGCVRGGGTESGAGGPPVYH